MSYFRPQPRAASPELKALLINLYPGLEIRSIDWYTGLPWFLSGFNWVSGITLPGTWTRSRVSIYLRNWEPSDPVWVALAVHEAFHALQMQEASERFPWHWGTWHPFLAVYLASWTRHGYRRHPLEMPAYNYEAAFSEAFEELENPEAWEYPDCLALMTGPVPAELVCHHAGFTYRDQTWRLIPALLILVPAGFIRPVGDAVISLMMFPSRLSRNIPTGLRHRGQ